MRRQSFPTLAVSVLTVILPGNAQAIPKSPPPKAIKAATAIWTLTGSTVVDAGETQTLAEGTFTKDVTIEATATSNNPDFIANGRFRLSLTAFSPKDDRPGQRKKFCYIRGKWTLADASLPAAETMQRKPGVVSGLISAELPFNPADTQSNWSALARLPMATFITSAGSQRARGEGALSLDKHLEGTLWLELNLWPKIP